MDARSSQGGGVTLPGHGPGGQCGRPRRTVGTTQDPAREAAVLCTSLSSGWLSPRLLPPSFELIKGSITSPAAGRVYNN